MLLDPVIPVWIHSQDQLEALVLETHPILGPDLQQPDQADHQLLGQLLQGQVGLLHLDHLQLGLTTTVLEDQTTTLALVIDHHLTIVQLEVAVEVIHLEETIKLRLKKKN